MLKPQRGRLLGKRRLFGSRCLLGHLHCLYILAYSLWRNDVIKRQTWSVVFTFYAAIFAMKKYFWREIWREILTTEVFYREHFRKLDSSFKIMVKFEIKEHWTVRLTTQKSLFRLCEVFVRSAFQFGFLPSKRFSSLEIHTGILVISLTKKHNEPHDLSNQKKPSVSSGDR